MDNIFQYGSYIVGSAKSYIFQHYHEVIQLTLKARDKPLTKTSYSLEELWDLESKLVLITGSKAENRAKVDIFIDVSSSSSEWYNGAKSVVWKIMFFLEVKV